jgi:hypothetical protein
VLDVIDCATNGMREQAQEHLTTAMTHVSRDGHALLDGPGAGNDAGVDVMVVYLSGSDTDNPHR